jgi:2-amino-4-hydroxy-6-hydroxymethyldihydropteridine diphosphokinase
MPLSKSAAAAMAEVYVALGSNLGDPAARMGEAVGRLAHELTVERVSSLYRTEPVGFQSQPDFLNAVVSARTDRSPKEMLEALVAIEAAMGRRRVLPGGPRTIDLDLLVVGDLVMRTPELVLPHPRMLHRRFVMEPLAEIAPRLRVPGTVEDVAELAARLPTAPRVERLHSDGWPPPLSGR